MASHMDSGRVPVLFIAGSGRSGSTLLERVLGGLDSFAPAGELRHMWQKSFVNNQACGCGQPFRECSFWQAVVRRAFGGPEGIDGLEAARLCAAVDRLHHIPQMRGPLRLPGYSRRLERYRPLVQRLYRAVHAEAGRPFIIDSTKDASTAYLLSTLPEIDLHVVHIVRDSRAVAFSRMRRKRRSPTRGPEEYMSTASPVRSAATWLYRNWIADGLQRVTPHYVRVRYEDLAADPARAIGVILRMAGLPEAPPDYLQEGRIQLGVDHIAGGNPIRFGQGEVAIRLDDEWQREMKPADRWIVTALTAPLLWQYGYPLRAPRKAIHG